MILSEELPCSKEEAAALAGIQLRIEESWPSKDKTVGGSLAQRTLTTTSGHDQDKLITISEDTKVSTIHFLTNYLAYF